MIVADNAGMADLAFRLHQMLLPHGIESDGAAPIPRWRPEGGFSTDPALIYALMRQESNFNPHAVSRAGARGVMQLMPSTARYIARASGLAGSAQLSRPESNIALGERYLKMLLADENVAGDLFRLAAAWNAGPGNPGAGSAPRALLKIRCCSSRPFPAARPAPSSSTFSPTSGSIGTGWVSLALARCARRRPLARL